jgi:hypothetical protein
MKKKLLLMMMCWPMVLSAQNGVTVSGLAVSAGSPTTVTFNVSWSNTGMPDVWSDTVWVWVDYNVAGVMERLPVTGGTASAGTVTKVSGNDKGVWLVGNARSAESFSAMVQLFTTENVVAGACAYASNYPPVGEYISASTSTISFTGTPPYNIVLKDAGGGTKTHTEDSPYPVPTGYTVQSFTDKTGAPGSFTCVPSTVYALQASAAGFCAGGAGVTFALSGTDNGRNYELYKAGTSKAVATLVGKGSAATFSGSFTAGTYTARLIPNPAFCPAEMTGSLPVVSNPLPATPNLAVLASTVCLGTSITFRVTMPESGVTYTWTGATGTASGTSDGTYTVSGATTGTKSVTASARLTSNGTTCQSSNSSLSAMVLQPSANGQTANATCGCVTGTNNCKGTCMTVCRAIYRDCGGGNLLGYNDWNDCGALAYSRGYSYYYTYSYSGGDGGNDHWCYGC